MATAFFVLRDTDLDVLLVERDRAGHGATGHNAGQLTTYFERPLVDLVDEFGVERALAAQREIDDSWDLLDTIIGESEATLRVDRFTGYLGMYSLNHLVTHLRESELREQGGLRVPTCLVSEDADFLPRIPSQYSRHYSVVPAVQVRELLETDDERYHAVMSTRGGCANGALLIHQVLPYLERRFAERFRYVDHTPVRHVRLDTDAAEIDTGGHVVTAGRVVMCTNGFVEHLVENRAGEAIAAPIDHRVSGTVGYMAGYTDTELRPPRSISLIRNAVIGESTPYVYMTRRRYDRGESAAMLTCIGGPEQVLDSDTTYRDDLEFPLAVMNEIDGEILPMVDRTRRSGEEYDYAWHGLMAYTDSKVRLIGFEPRNPVLLYNLGCNGVGFLPSIYGGSRIAELVAGRPVEPSIFDPR